MSQYPPPVPNQNLNDVPPLPLPTLVYATPQGSGMDLKRVAAQQRAINLCILAEIIIIILQVAHLGMPQMFALAMALVFIGVAITAAVFIFMLALSVYGTATGIVLGILSLIPYLGVLILLVVNGKATKILRQHGIKVGLLGADPSKIPAGGPPYPTANPR